MAIWENRLFILFPEKHGKNKGIVYINKGNDCRFQMQKTGLPSLPANPVT